MAVPRQLRLGVIGLGTEWRDVYQPACERLSPRMMVAALQHDSRRPAEEAAQALGARVRSGVRALLRENLDGVVVASRSGYGWFPIRESIRAGRDCYSPVPEDQSVTTLTDLASQAQSAGVLIMPELRLRYTPATLRLRELMATELGPLASLEIRSLTPLPVPPARIELELIDWCRLILPGSPRTIESHTRTGEAGTMLQSTRLRFRSGVGEIDATLEISAADPAESHRPFPAADVWPLEFFVQGKYGEARLEDSVHLRWRIGGRERVESLAVDRSAVAVAIDHFVRRLAGGLIPVPSLEDLLQSARLVNHGQHSREQGSPIDLAGDRR